MRRSTKRISGAAAALAVAAALALCGPAAYAAPAAPGDAQAPAAGAQPADGGPAAQADAAQPAQADASQPEASQADGAQAEPARSEAAALVSLSYSAHVSNIGWMGAVAGGEVAGTTGRGLPLEALRLVLSDASTGEPLGADAISVEAHVSNVGWQAAVGNGGTAGTTGQSRAVEALRVRLSGELSARYTVWYRVHSAEFGWLGWACDGADAGSAGYGRAVQAVQVAVLPKGDPAPGDTACPFKSRSDEPASITVRSHTSNIGWMSPVGGGSVAGTTGRGLPMEALEAQLGWYGHSGSIELRGHVSNVGWQQWSEGHCGTTGKSQRLEAVQIRLTGEAAEKYDIWYCAHVSGIGWLDWACNGAAAGSAGKGKAIEAVKVILVEKGGAAPGSSSKVFIGDLDAVAVSGSAVSGESLGLSSGQKATIGGKGAKLLNSIALSVAGQTDDGSISYAVMDAYSGWGASESDGGAAKAVSGAPIKAIKMSLSGQFAANYDIWYRVYDSGNGWTGWTSNGQACGVTGGSSGLCGIDVALVRKGQPAPGSTGNAFTETSGIGLVSQAHVASAGWLAPVGNGETAGQTGMSRSLQALYISTQGIDASVEVSAHVANIGWQPYVSGASYAGTVGKGLAIQAVKLRLTGNDSSKYNIYYRIHAADYGWLGWAKNDAAAGTVGLSKQAEAIQIKLVAKGSSDAPVQDHAALIQLPGLSAKANCSGLGWQASVGNGGVAGTVGQNRAIEAMQLSLSDSSMNGGISYSAHVSNIGWQSAVSDGATAGTIGQGQQIQAVKINLTGDVSNYFDVWYRVHVSNYGWLGWTKNGSPAGTTKLGIPVQALQVKIVPKGASAPGSTSDSYFETYRYMGYQTPGSYPKVSCNSVQLPSYCTGYFTYVTPSRIPYNASRQDCINAFVQRAREYIGTRYIEPWSSWPGDAVDCSGLVLQCLYATGMDMGWYNPYNHRWLPEQTYNSMNWYRNNTFMPVSTSAMQRGDVVYYQGHIGIYIGNGRIIDSWPGIGVTERSVNAPGRVIGAARPFA